MGKNYFQAIPIKPSYDEKLISFTSSLGKAMNKGETIPFADNDVTYTLNLQHERIKENNIEYDYKVYKRTRDSRLGNVFYDVEDWEDKHYTNTVGFASLGVRRLVRKNGNVLYRDTLRHVFYGTVTDVVSGSHPDNETHICPNCGADSTIEELQNGCPYCGTQYKMDDLFPKITSYYFFDQLRLTKKQLLIGWPVCSLVCAIAGLVLIPILKTVPAIAREIDRFVTSYSYSVILYCILAVIMYGFFLFLFAI